MGRGVSYPRNAAEVAFQYHESYYYCSDCGQKIESDTCPNDPSWEDDSAEPHTVYLTNDWDDFDEFIWWVQERCKEAWPSLEDADHWLGREDHVILENGHAQIGVSEYCGTVAVWIVVPEDDYYPQEANIAYHWVGQIRDKFHRMFGEMHKIGTMSNGVSVYRKV